MIHINQYNTDNQIFLKKSIDIDKKKKPDTSGLVTITVLNIKINKIKNKIPDNSKHITVQEFN